MLLDSEVKTKTPLLSPEKVSVHTLRVRLLNRLLPAGIPEGRRSYRARRKLFRVPDLLVATPIAFPETLPRLVLSVA